VTYVNHILAGEGWEHYGEVDRIFTVCEPAHGVVYGQKKRGGIGGKLRDGALWVARPVELEVN
jgi:hypothetical protein